MLINILGGHIDEIITSENGASTTVNRWFQLAGLGIPFLIPRVMGGSILISVIGAMGLIQMEDYISIQAAFRRKPENRQEIRACR